MKNDRIFKMPFAAVYPAYINKAERKGRTKEEVHTIIYWLTGYDEIQFEQLLEAETNFEDCFCECTVIKSKCRPNKRCHLWV